MTPQVVTLGEAMALFLAEDGMPVTEADRFRRSVAGAESNVAIGLARLGHTVQYCGRVGADPMGTGISRTLRGEGVDVSALTVDDRRPTGLLIRDAPAGVPVTVTYRRDGSAGSALDPADLPVEALAAADIVHLSALTASLSPSAEQAVLLAAGTARGKVVLDPNIRTTLAPPRRWRELVERLAPAAHTVLVGADELAVLDVDACWFLDRGCSLVVVKNGARGASATDGVNAWHTDARTVPVVDPVGAGDAFAAGWISAMLRGKAVPESLTEATTVASCVVAARGDLPGLPTAATRDALIAGNTDVIR